MIFDYARAVEALGTISVEDIGNTCLNALNDEALEWYLIIDTHNGWTKVTEFGPIRVDSNSLVSNFHYEFSEREFSENYLSKTIDKFINNPRFRITQVFELSKDLAHKNFDNIRNSL